MATPPFAEGAPGRKPPKPGQLYADAVWDAGPDELTQAELAMALCYANHAHRAPYDRARVTTERLMQQCKIRSTSTVTRVRDSLVAKGWLVALHPQTGVPLSEAERRGFQKKRKTIPYRLTVPASSTIEEAASAVGVEEAPSTTSTIEATTSIIDPRYFDDRQLPSYDPPKNPLSLGEPDRQTAPAVVSTAEEREDRQGEDPTPTPAVHGVPADLVRQTMSETTATAEEFVRVVEAARRAGVHSPGPWLLSKAGKVNFQQRLDELRAGVDDGPSVPVPPPVSDYWAAARNACEHGTPGGAARCALCRTQAPARPPLAERQAPTPAIPQDLTALREALSSFTTRSGPRRPALDIQPRTAPETPPEVAAAHATLARHGNAFGLMAAARKRLGNQAHRDEVVVLAAELAREERPAQAFA